MRTWSRRILAFLALFGGTTPWIADYNETHIFNPTWPPHAVFHDGQVLVFASLSAAASLLFLYRGEGDAWSNFLAAWWLVSLYWFSLTAAALFPRAAWLDPELVGDPSQYILGVPGNAFVCALLVPSLFVLLWMGWTTRDMPVPAPQP